MNRLDQATVAEVLAKTYQASGRLGIQTVMRSAAFSVMAVQRFTPVMHGICEHENETYHWACTPEMEALWVIRHYKVGGSMGEFVYLGPRVGPWK